MLKKLFKLEIIGFIFTAVLGTLFHFMFEWSGYNRIIAIFTPVNESSWEHLKMLFFPYLTWSIVEYLLLREKASFIFSKAVGALSGMFFIVSFFYTYTGIIGKNIDFLNILSFFIGIFLAFLIDYLMIRSEKFSSVAFDCIGIGIFIFICVLFFIFTSAPPFIPLFKDPVSQSYGI